MNKNNNRNPNFGFINHLSQKNNNYNQNNSGSNYSGQSGVTSGVNSAQPSSNHKKKDLRIALLKSFDSLNEDFIYISPLFIPFLPGNDPNDKYNEEEHL